MTRPPEPVTRSSSFTASPWMGGCGGTRSQRSTTDTAASAWTDEAMDARRRCAPATSRSATLRLSSRTPALPPAASSATPLEAGTPSASPTAGPISWRRWSLSPPGSRSRPRSGLRRSRSPGARAFTRVEPRGLPIRCSNRPSAIGASVPRAHHAGCANLGDRDQGSTSTVQMSPCAWRYERREMSAATPSPTADASCLVAPRRASPAP